jgi:hypothetical protein
MGTAIQMSHPQDVTMKTGMDSANAITTPKDRQLMLATADGGKSGASPWDTMYRSMTSNAPDSTTCTTA